MGERHVKQLGANLFRRESGKLVSVLTRIFGSENLDLAEDVVQDSLIEVRPIKILEGING